MLLELGMAVGGGILNALAGAEQNRAEEKKKQQALSLLRENIIDPDELDALMRDINSTFNNKLVTTLNSTALSSRGVANNQVAKGVAAGQVEGQRYGTLADARFRALDSNKQTNAAMASVIAGSPTPSSGVGDFFEGAMTAAPIGMELSKMLNPSIASTLGGAGGAIGEGGVSAVDSKGFSGSYSGPKFDDSNFSEDFGTFGKLWGHQGTIGDDNRFLMDQVGSNIHYGRGR